MEPQQFDQIADHIVNAHHAKRSYSREFFVDYGQPPNLIAKAQHARSVLQATLNADERYDLGSDFAEFGRVEVFDRLLEHTFVLRSAGAVAVERVHQLRRYQLFSDVTYVDYMARPESLLIYGAVGHDLMLAVGDAESKRDSRRLELVGEPVEVGHSQLRVAATDGADSFDQGKDDDFKDLDDDLGLGEPDE